MSLVPDGTGADAAASSGRAAGPTAFGGKFVPDDHVTLDPFPSAFGAVAKNTGITFKVVPDETMRSLELRKGSIDLVVNDLSPDLVTSLRNLPHLQVVTAPGTDYAYLGFNLRDPILADLRVRQAVAAAIDVGSIVTASADGLAAAGNEHRAAGCPGPTPTISRRRPTTWPGLGALLDEAGHRDLWQRPSPPSHPDAQDLNRGSLPGAGGRDSTEPVGRRHRAADPH